MKKIKTVLTILLLASIIAVGSVSSYSIEPPVSPMVFGIHEIGTGGHRIISTILEGINEKYPDLTIRTMPSGVELVRVYLVRMGETLTGFGATFLTYTLQEGIELYDEREWGPQPVRHLWISRSPAKGLALRADSDIFTFDDLRGKKVAHFEAYPASQKIVTALLRFGGLTWDDVVPVDFSSHAESYRAVKDGRIDVTMYNPLASAAYELEAAHGIRYLEMPEEDKEGWARVAEYTSLYPPLKATRGAGLSEENPVPLLTEGYPIFFAYDSLDEDIAYWIVRAIHESREYYIKRDPYLEEDWAIETFLDFWDSDTVPMHDGAIRYLKELGYWTPEREQMNQNRLEHQKALKATWDSVVIEAEQQKIKSVDFPKFWLEKRAEAGF